MVFSRFRAAISHILRGEQEPATGRSTGRSPSDKASQTSVCPRSWKIHQKIGYGYLLSIGIGFLGSITGMLIADYYQGQSIEQLWDAQQQSQLLREFERTANAFQLHTLRLANSVDQPTALKEYARLQTAAARIQVLEQQIEMYLASDPDWLATQSHVLSNLIASYSDQIAGNTKRIEAQIGVSPTGQPNLLALQNPLLKSIETGSGGRIDQLNRQLVEIVSLAEIQTHQAGEAMEYAQGFEKLIITLSMMGFAAIAGIWAWRTTRAIAQPIEQVTQLAEQVATESNFELRVPITTQDEIGLLAQSINQLIERVAERTQSLQQAVQHAEQQTQILQRTLAELQKTQTHLVQSEKMSSLGQMIAGIAHEINNPVSFIHGNLKYAKQYVADLLRLVELYHASTLNPSSEIQQHRSTIDFEFIQADLPKLLLSLEMGTERIRSIVLSLRIFSRLNEAALKAVNLQDGIESTLVILGNRLRAAPHRPEITVVKQYGNLPLVECYAGQLNQVFMNILSNAIDAIEDRIKSNSSALLETPTEEPSPQSSSQENWQPSILIRTTVIDADWVSIEIGDNGLGIPEAVRHKIFDPFFTTKPVGKGTGLGMSISYAIVVEKHCGQLSFESQSGSGTTFKLQLPVHLSKQMSRKKSSG
ncbi:HAMP domain-containing protein [Oscillatoria sp. FACHB-1407]|uniref:sensor histidine kinase n=1 Tax=Oscillatoria sp. FACHB-1407 TaxID=2692847 RepID=UPI001688BF96|nr:ATP-binding protein [Oscillatoria sp. FACHB-1407]MBD2461392.1 HAMP domain-containing protein [Oscillatoria sp. FACHB-1407]